MTNNGWKGLLDLKVGDYLEMDFNDYFPVRYKEYRSVKIDENMGWLIGLLVSEGTVTNRNFVNISNTNISLIESIINTFPNFDWINTPREAYTDPRGWKCKKCYNLQYSNTRFSYYANIDFNIII